MNEEEFKTPAERDVPAESTETPAEQQELAEPTIETGGSE